MALQRSTASKHEIMPDPMSVTSERTGVTASILDPHAYPLLATCTACGEQIRITHYIISAEWSHTAPDVG